jgi:small subunit ribosomal protein S17
VTAMKERGTKRQMIGTVVSNKADKTVSVVVERLVRHKMYHKIMRRRSKFAAHDDRNDCQIGDRVLISESRPLSKSKRWRVIKIVEKAV